jgi:hypothetical protein
MTNVGDSDWCEKHVLNILLYLLFQAWGARIRMGMYFVNFRPNRSVDRAGKSALMPQRTELCLSNLYVAKTLKLDHTDFNGIWKLKCSHFCRFTFTPSHSRYCRLYCTVGPFGNIFMPE